MPPDRPLLPDTQELILCTSQQHACETYLFEPGSGENKLGWLFAAVHTDNRGGVGTELIDTVVTAIQREYYRDSDRTPGTSFEMALHQANLILHDMAEQGMREWMPNFQATVAVLTGSELHISVAGYAQALLIRKGAVTEISADLAHVPITNPLQTFSQVASGVITPRDLLLLSTEPTTSLFSTNELTRTAMEQSAEAAVTRLRQRYGDAGHTVPLAAIVIMMLPQYVSTKQSTSAISERVSRAVNQEHLLPREPLAMRRSRWQRLAFMFGGAMSAAGQFAKQRIWPMLKIGSQRGSRVIAQASRATGKSIHAAASGQKLTLPNVRNVPRVAAQRTLRASMRLQQLYVRLPKSSKVFAIISVVLVILLTASILFLQSKRTADIEIQQASESLHQARTKTEAAKTALIYDNRDQARGLLNEARQGAETLVAGELYVEEARGLLADIDQQFDRLQRVTRAVSESSRTVGDFAEHIRGMPQRLFLIDDTLYTYHPDTNAIVSLQLDGTTNQVHGTTQGIGFFASGIVHPADKTITFITDPVGVALFDTKDNSLSSQEIDFPSSKPSITGAAVFGNRLYVLDAGASNIFVYNKTLRGYSSGSPWITDNQFPVNTVTSFSVDGNIYTLHQNGAIRQLFKGEAVDFQAEVVQPPISPNARLITSDELRNLYIVDSVGKRVIIYDKQGQLIRQVLVEFAQNFADAAVHPEEDKLYVLDGTRVLEISLGE